MPKNWDDADEQHDENRYHVDPLRKKKTDKRKWREVEFVQERIRLKRELAEFYDNL